MEMIRLLLLLLLLPAVNAATISDVGLEYNGAPVEYLAPGASFDADFVFDTQGEDLDCEEANCQGVLEFNGEESQFSLSECEFNQSYSCSQEVFIDSFEHTYSLLIFSQGLVADKEGVITLTEDNTTPVLAELTTGLCQGETCYVGSNAETPVQARFEDELTAFEQRLVRFDIGGASQHAQSCEGKTCEATVRTSSCVDGNTVEVSVVNFFGSMPSSEDARNAVDNSLTIDAICDSTNPVIENFAIRSGGPVPAVYETASPLEVQATITDMPGGAVSLVVESENLTDETFRSECSETDNGRFVCDAAINNLNQGQHDVTFRFLDGVGNFVEETRTQLLVLESVEQNETDLVDIRVTDITPQPMNRVALQLAMENAIHYPILVDYVLQGDATVVGQSLQNLECVWDDRSITNESSNRNLFSLERSSILKPNADVNEENRFIFNFHTSAGELPDVVHARCTYDVYVAEDDQFYATPEREDIELTLAFKNSVLGQPGEAFVEEIKRAEAEIDGGAAKALETLNEIGGYADSLCGGYYTLASVDALATTLQGSQYFKSIGDGIDGVMEPIFGLFVESSEDPTMSAFQQATGDDIPDNMRADVGFAMLPRSFSIHDMCNWWTCKDAAESDGFLGPAGLGCSDINAFLGGESVDEAAADLESGETAVSLPQRSEYEQRQQIIVPDGTDTSGMAEHGASYVANPFNVNAYQSLTQGEYCAPRYDKSLLTSAGLYGTGFCAKGVLFNLGKYHGIDCGYLSCLKEQSELGANINVCKQARDFKQCTQVAGEFSEFPIMNVFTRTSAMVNANVQDIGLNLLNSGLNAYCAPGSEVLKQVTNEVVTTVVRSALDAATSGVYSGVMETLNMLNNVLNFADKGFRVSNAVTKSTPTSADSSQLLCDIRDSFFRLSEVNSMLNGGLAMSVADTTAMCEDARCNGPDCERSGITSSFLSDMTRHGLLIAGEKGDDVTYEERLRVSMDRAYFDGYEGISEQLLEQQYAGIGDIARSELTFSEFSALTDNAIRNNPGVNNDDDAIMSGVMQQLEEGEVSSIDSSEIAVAVVGSRNDLLGAADGTQLEVNDEDSSVTATYEGVSADVDTDESTAKEIKAADSDDDDTVSRDELDEQREEVDPEGTEKLTAQEVAEQRTSALETNENAVQTYLDRQEEIEDCTGSSSCEIDINYDDDPITFADDDGPGVAAEKLEGCSNGKSCYRTVNGDFAICDEGGQNCEKYEYGEVSGRDDLEDTTMEVLGIAIDFAVKWAYDQGYLDDLKFSSWGDWGAEKAREADKLFNPDTWVTNMCSNEIEVLTSDDPLTGLATTTGPVLTFAAEERVINETFIYSISYFIRNAGEDYPDANGRNKVWLKFDGEDINWTQNATEGVVIDEGEQLSGAFSFNDTTDYNEFCVVFNKPFPDNLGTGRFCREIVGDAFER